MKKPVTFPRRKAHRSSRTARPEFSRRVNPRVRVRVGGWMVETFLLLHEAPIPPNAREIRRSIEFQEFLENPSFPDFDDFIVETNHLFIK